LGIKTQNNLNLLFLILCGSKSLLHLYFELVALILLESLYLSINY